MRGSMLAAVFAAVLVAGCGQDGAAPAKPGGGSDAPKPRRPDTLTVEAADAAALDKAVAAQSKQVVLVEFWSLGDAKADERLAEAIDFQLIKGGFGLETFLVCVDGPAKKAEAAKLLEASKAVGPHYVLADPAKDRAALGDKFGYAGKTPHQVVFARDGKRAWKTGDPITVKSGKGKDGDKEAGDRDKFEAILFHELDQR